MVYPVVVGKKGEKALKAVLLVKEFIADGKIKLINPVCKHQFKVVCPLHFGVGAVLIVKDFFIKGNCVVERMLSELKGDGLVMHTRGKMIEHDGKDIKFIAISYNITYPLEHPGDCSRQAFLLCRETQARMNFRISFGRPSKTFSAFNVVTPSRP